MGFVERRMTEEDERWLEKFNLSGWEYGRYITEDKEENAKVICTGGQGHMSETGEYYSDVPLIFYLIWNDCPIYIECYYKEYDISLNPRITAIIYSIKKIRNETLRLKQIGTPDLKEHVKALVKEGIKTHGYTSQSRRTYENVEFINVAEPIGF